MNPPASPVSLKRALQEALAAERRRVLAEIAGYPPPITGCDAQFNFLLERRDALSRELRALDGIDDLGALHEFAAASTQIDAATRRHLLARREGHSCDGGYPQAAGP